MVRFLPALVLSFFSLNIFAQVTVVKDVNTNPGGIIPDYYGGTRFCNCGNYLYFNFENGNQTELWRTDGTETGTLKVLNQRGVFGGSESLCHNGLLYFPGNDGNTGFELWATDGTPQGTRLIKDLVKGPDGSGVENFTLYKGKIYFTTRNNYYTLWQTEGTENSTTVLQSFSPEHALVTLTASDRYLYIDHYNANTSSSQLMRSEGPASSNSLLSSHANFIYGRMAIGDHFFYSSSVADANQNELWVNDEVNNTITILNEASYIYSFHKYNNKLIFNSNQATWTSDGTKNGTQFISPLTFDNGVLYGGLLYGHHFNGTKYSLVKTDGLTVSFVLDLNLPIADFLSSPPAILNDKFILSISTNETGAEPALTDLTPNGTHVIKDVRPGIEGSHAGGWTTFNNKVFFLANDATHGRELWMTDGTEAGTKLVKDIAYGTEDGVIGDIISFKDYIYFMGELNGKDVQLLKAKENNPVQLIETFEYRPSLIGRSNGYLYFMWNTKFIKSDGEHPYSLVRDFSGQFMGGGWTIDGGFTVGNKFIYGFSTYSGPINLGDEFWVTDGTESGTHVLKDINPGAGSGAVFYYGAVLNQHFIFGGNDGTSGLELWISDGTESGTTLLKDINPGADQSQPSAHTILGDRVLFIANDGTHGNELWSTDGTPAGTLLIKDINPGSNGSDIIQMTLLEKHLFFWAKDDTHGVALWKTDGTENGTVFVKGISPAGLSARYLAATGTRLFLTADDGTHGNELWVSNGTTEGTTLIDVTPGAASSNPTLLGTGDDFVFFTSNQKLWISDGTAINTFVIADIKTEKVIYQDGWLYFMATTPAYGYEVYKLQLTKKNQTITFSIPEKVYGESPFNLNATSSSGMQISFTSQSSKISIQNNSTVSLLQPGSVTVKASQPGNALYNPAEVSASFCINPAKPQITAEDLITSVKLSSSSTEGNTWFTDGEKLSATTATLAVTQSGVYTVQVTVDNCKSEMSDGQNIKIKETISGLDETGEGISFSPNPASTQLYIQSLLASRTQIEIYSINGKLLDQFNLDGNSSTQYSLHDYPPGLYITRLHTGDRVHVNKFIKE